MNRSIEETGRTKSIAPEDFRRILELARTSPKERFLLYFIGNLGLRVGEAVRVEIGGIDFEKKVLKIPKIKTVGRRLGKRTVSGIYEEFPINDLVLNEVALYLKGHPWIMTQKWLFPGSGSSFMPIRKAQYIFYKYARKLGINASIHSLRHMQGYLIYKTTSDIRAVQVMLRHKSMETSTIYAEPTLDVKRDIREMVGTISDDKSPVTKEGTMEKWSKSIQARNLKRGFTFREEMHKSHNRGKGDKYR